MRLALAALLLVGCSRQVPTVRPPTRDEIRASVYAAANGLREMRRACAARAGAMMVAGKDGSAEALFRSCVLSLGPAYDAMSADLDTLRAYATAQPIACSAHPIAAAFADMLPDMELHAAVGDGIDYAAMEDGERRARWLEGLCR